MFWRCFRAPEERGESESLVFKKEHRRESDSVDIAAVLAIGHVRARVFHSMNIDEILMYWGVSEIREVQQDPERTRDLLHQLHDDRSSAFQQFALLPRGGDEDARRFNELVRLHTDGVRYRLGDGIVGQPIILKGNGVCRLRVIASIIFGIFECPVEESEKEKSLMAAFLHLLDQGEIPLNISFVNRFSKDEHDHQMTPIGYLLLYSHNVAHRARRERIWTFVCSVLERAHLPTLYLPGYQGAYGLLNCTTGEPLSNAYLCYRLLPHEVADCVLVGKMDVQIAGDEPETVRSALERRHRREQERYRALLEIEKGYLAVRDELGALRMGQNMSKMRAETMRILSGEE